MSLTGPRQEWHVAGQTEELLLERFPMLGSGRRAVKGSEWRMCHRIYSRMSRLEVV